MSWLIAGLGFAVLIVLHELGHFAVAKAVGMRVERFALFFPPLIARRKRGETEYALGVIPLGGYVRITGMSPREEIPPSVVHRAYYRQPVWKRIAVIVAGPLVNIFLAFVILFSLLVFHGTEKATMRVGEIEKNSPAAAALRPGDRLISIDGVRGDQTQLRAQVAKHRCPGEQVDGCRAATPAIVVVDRAGQQLTRRVRPAYDETNSRSRLGFQYATQADRQSAGQAATRSLDMMWLLTRRSVETIVRILDPEFRRQVSGVVGSYEVTRQAVQFDAVRALEILALISLSLGVVNLFPFLPLDGGHIFWAVAEKIRGRRISFELMERAGFVGFVLVMLLFVIGLTNDIGRLTGEGFGVR